MLASTLHWRFLDVVSGNTPDGPIGIDFFQAPRGYRNLLAGNNIYLTEISDYGPSYATSFFDHPFLAVAVGPWTAHWPPWVAFGVYECACIGLLALGAWRLSKAFDDPLGKAFCYFAMLCGFPVFCILWTGQMHVFVVLGVALVLAGLMRLEQEPQRADRHIRWIQLGLLISLLSKPVVALMLPVLFILPETRRKLLLPVAVYAVLSLSFLLAPRLNPGGYNCLHWLHIPAAVFKHQLAHRVLYPVPLDLSHEYWIRSLPMLLNAAGAGPIVLLIAKLPVAAVALMSLTPLLLPDRGQRIRAAVLTASLCVLSYDLTYFQAFEYHYATLLPLLPAMLWLGRRESVPWLRRVMLGSFIVSLSFLLPSLCFLTPLDPRCWVANTLQRVTPVIVAFLGLSVYGVASTWRARRRPRLVTRQMIHGMGPAVCLGGLLGLLFAAVAAAAYATMPARFLIATQNWTPRDWETHLEDVISRPGVAPEVLADIHRSLGRWYAPAEPRIALEHYRKAAAFQSNSAEFRADLGNAFLGLRQFGEAVEQWEQALQLDPRSSAAHNNLGAALAGCGRLDEAAASYRKALEIKPDYAEAQINLGVALTRSGRIGEAMAQFQRALEITPDDAEAHNDLGFALAGRGRIDEAMAHFEKALRIDPNHVLARNNLGLALAGRGRIDEAMAQYQQALKLKPDYAEAHLNLGIALTARGRNDEAMAHYQEALKIKPDYAQAHVHLGMALTAHGRIDEAMAQYQQALKIKPDYAEAHVNLGTALANLGRIDAAIAEFQKALEIEPDYAEAHINLGVALAGRGRLDAAMAHFQQALKIKPDYAEAHKNLGIALAGCGRIDEAIDHYQKALVLARQQNKAGLAEELATRLRTYNDRIPKATDVR